MALLKKFNSWATHLPLLTAILTRTTGPVLELGPGVYSTPCLAEICKAMGRPYLGLDCDPKWIGHSEQLMRAPNQKVKLLSSWKEGEVLEAIKDFYPEVAFIDQFPDGSRIGTLRTLASKVDVIVCHDTSPNMDRRMGLRPELDKFKYRYTYDGLMPWTDAVSHFKNLGGYLKEQRA